MLEEFEINATNPTFIGAWFLPDISICDELIEHWRNSPEKKPGAVGDITNTGTVVQTKIKDSLDLTISTGPSAPDILKRYAVQLQQCVKEYKNKWHWAGEYSPFGLLEPINIQYYAPGQGFHQWHAERINSHFPTITRHLVFMTYLNDVTDDGETEWFYQKLKIQPKKGLTVIWPADWTYTHRGVASNTQEKWIITGWYNLVAGT
jgi:hypothetical protein